MKKIAFILFLSILSNSVFPNTNFNTVSSGVFDDFALTITATNGTVLKLIANEETDQNSFQSGQVVCWVTRPAVGYKFSHWTGNVSWNRLMANVVMTRTKTVTAVFEKDY
ncbi:MULTISPECIES: InlB B-repeat-containing protein [Cellulophaga]|uniref:Bacterial repeat domain-containing protein n=1 Tax=Cellulophaga baltica 18 TaxID=1348584 RepID=A0AAU8RI18_9FLAO|nr:MULTISPECIES: hypothetical protein [Cellulophaga]AIZ42698.1 hypothetical protein M666_14625 [Cellulophaga baltica 18]KGK28833.1 hypothetical protein EL45_18630 [Cellulophaga sp. E6(2014)]